MSIRPHPTVGILLPSIASIHTMAFLVAQVEEPQLLVAAQMDQFEGASAELAINAIN